MTMRAQHQWMCLTLLLFAFLLMDWFIPRLMRAQKSLQALLLLQHPTWTRSAGSRVSRGHTEANLLFQLMAPGSAKECSVRRGIRTAVCILFGIKAKII